MSYPFDPMLAPCSNEIDTLYDQLELTGSGVDLAWLPIDPAVMDALAIHPWPASLERAVPKRRREFLAGRLCARMALQRAGHISEGLLPVGDDRLPVWPQGWCGSISHSPLAAVAAVARTGDCPVLGVDMETWIEASTASAIAPQIGSANEWELFESDSTQYAVTRLFSAKEALFKALFPQTRRFFDFHAARADEVRPNTLALRLSEDWSTHWPAGSLIKVRQTHSEAHIFSLVYFASSRFSTVS